MILLNSVEVEFGKFPNGESNLNFNKIEAYTGSTITLRFQTDQDLFNLLMLKSYLDDVGITEISLEILYMPYSRMDRRNDFYTFNLKYVCNLINAMKFTSVRVWDAHSDVTLALLDRSRGASFIPNLFSQFRQEFTMDDTFIMYPDAGAQKRFEGMFAYPSIVGKKIRNFENGEILKFGVDCGDIDLSGSSVVIVDDLCSKGGTFVAAAQALKERGVKDIYLIVAHCENTIMQGDIFDAQKGKPFKKVYTTNSIYTLLDAPFNESDFFLMPAFAKKVREK